MLLIELVRGQLPPRLQVQLVPAPEDAGAVLLHAAVAEGRDLVDGLAGVLGSEGGELLQPLPVFGEAYRHDGDAVDTGVHPGQVLHGALQSFPVVPAGAADDLAVHHDPRRGEAAHDLDALAGPPVFQHPAAELRVRGVDGDVHRAHVQIDDPLDLPGGEIGQGDVVSQQKAEPGVVVFEIHRFPHALGQLVDEAEDAVVGAGAGIVHQVALKVQPQVAALPLVHGHVVLRPVGTAQQHVKPGVVGVELVVQHVQHPLAVDGDQIVAHPGMMPQGARGVDGFDDVIHIVLLISSPVQGELARSVSRQRRD